MTDYKEEQTQEIEALESIYPEEMEVLTTEPFHKFQLSLSTSCDDEDAENASCKLQFTYTATYPDEAPVIELEPDETCKDDHIEKLVELMKESAEENLGMAMIFTIYSAAQEKFDDLVESAAVEKRDAREAKIKAEEEAERKRLEGTHVTVESFLAWKTKFDAEMEEKNRIKGVAKVKKDSTKLTGKEMFLQNSALDDSDVKFLEEEGEPVEVDESLFQDIDDLDLDDELLDDELEGAAKS